jgi:arabinofuranosyltransferase
MARPLKQDNIARPTVAQEEQTNAALHPPTNATTAANLRSTTYNQQSILALPWLWLGIALLLLGWHEYFLNSRANLGGWGVDDAWITFRYSHNLALGNGPVWNVGEQVEGYTNFLWMVIIAAAMKLGFTGIGVSILLGALAGLATLPLTYLLAETGPRRGQLPAISAAVTILLALDGSFATWSIAGLETSFYTMLLTGGLLCCVRALTLPSAGGRGDVMPITMPAAAKGAGIMTAEERLTLAAGLLLILAAMTRPEGLMVYAIGLAFLLLRAWRGQGFGRYLLFYLAPAVIIYLPYFIWRWSYYGWPLPNTFYNKVGSGWAQIQRGLDYESKFRDKHSELFFVIPLLALVREKLTYRFSLLLTVALAYWAYIIYVGGDWDWAVGRFFVPILPVLAVLNADGLKSLYLALVNWRSNAQDDPPANPPVVRKWLLVGLGVITLAIVGQSTYDRTSAHGEQNNLNYYQGVAAALYSCAQYIDDPAHSKPTDLIATTAAGVLPFYSNRPYLDVLGLTDEHIAHVYVPDIGLGRAGHEKEDADYVLSRKPQYIVLTISLEKTDFSKVAGFAQQYALVNWTTDAGYAQAIKVYKRKP